MWHDLGFRDLEFAAECLNEHVAAFDLGRGGGRIFEIAHQADADANLVVIAIRTAGMGSLDLGPPAERGLDGSVGHAAAVADHKVVANPQPGFAVLVFLLLMSGVNAVDAARLGGGVMEHDVLPVAGGTGRSPGLVAGADNGSRVGHGGSARELRPSRPQGSGERLGGGNRRSRREGARGAGTPLAATQAAQQQGENHGTPAHLKRSPMGVRMNPQLRYRFPVRCDGHLQDHGLALYFWAGKVSTSSRCPDSGRSRLRGSGKSSPFPGRFARAG